MEAIVGPEPGKIVAEALTRVLDLAFDEGHPDPRHSEHWWDWRDWPFDGRQWTYDGSINRYKLDKKSTQSGKGGRTSLPTAGWRDLTYMSKESWKAVCSGERRNSQMGGLLSAHLLECCALLQRALINL